MNDALEINNELVSSRIRKRIYRIIKRTFDLFFSIIGIFFLIPITIFIKICYVLTGDFHRVIFIQKRIGKNGKEFNFYKFRSMVPNADQVLFELLKKDKKIAKNIN